MDIQKQMLACAEIDGLELKTKSGVLMQWVFERGIAGTFPLPNYDTDNEIDRMVRELGDDEKVRYAIELSKMHIADDEEVGMFPDSDNPLEAVELLIRALTQSAVSQKREALIRATGKWEGES